MKDIEEDSDYDTSTCSMVKTNMGMNATDQDLDSKKVEFKSSHSFENIGSNTKVWSYFEKSEEEKQAESEADKNFIESTKGFVKKQLDAIIDSTKKSEDVQKKESQKESNGSNAQKINNKIIRPLTVESDIKGSRNPSKSTEPKKRRSVKIESQTDKSAITNLALKKNETVHDFKIHHDKTPKPSHNKQRSIDFKNKRNSKSNDVHRLGRRQTASELINMTGNKKPAIHLTFAENNKQYYFGGVSSDSNT